MGFFRDGGLQWEAKSLGSDDESPGITFVWVGGKDL